MWFLFENVTYYVDDKVELAVDVVGRKHVLLILYKCGMSRDGGVVNPAHAEHLQ